jgi:hypothetical protein
MGMQRPSWWPSWLGWYGGNSKSSQQPQQDPTDDNSPQQSLLPPQTSRELGKLSEKYESNGNPGAVSSGNGDPGGVSYGTYQLTTGNVQRFLQSPVGLRWADEFQGLVPGSKEFGEIWKEIAQQDPTTFGDAQHTYIKITHFDPMVKNLESTIGLDITHQSAALQDVVWSTSVQHGPNAVVIQNALAGQDASKMTDKEMIVAIYNERGRTDANGLLVYFRSSSLAVQRGVANRFKNEMQDALGMLDSD